MVKPVFRRKSIGTKVSEEEYAKLEALAGGRAMSEWVREVLLRELDGRQARPAEETLLAEVLALRTILLNAFYHTDALGSDTQGTTYSGSASGAALLYPWGQGWVPLNNGTIFAGFQDWDGGTDSFPGQFRMYAAGQYRWLTPDPAGLGAVDLSNPQSLNRYAYALNNPTTLTDPLGLAAGDCDKTNPNCPGPGRSNYGGINDAIAGRGICNLQFNSMPCYPWNASQEMLQGLAAYTTNLQLLGTGLTVLPNGTIQQWVPGGQVGHTFSFGGGDSGTTAQGQWQSAGTLVPDFFQYTININPPTTFEGTVFGATFTLTTDKYHKLYFGAGYNVGRGASIVSGSATPGWMLAQPATPQSLNALLTGGSWTAGGSTSLFAGGFTTTNSSGTAVMAGPATPQYGFSYTVSTSASSLWSWFGSLFGR